MRPSRLRVAVSSFALCALGGCSVLGNPANTKNLPPSEPEGKSADYGPIAPLLEMMSALPQKDPARQAELFQSAKDQASLSPTTSNRLRYALALGVPGHSGSDPVAAQRQLSELLARPETLLPDERLLALVELQEVDQRLVLQTENQRLLDEASHDSRDKLQAVNRRLQAESDENARLRKALDEARAKLDAVTHIERSITERAATEPHTP
jgi:two-component sensor histidine kinase